MFFPLNGLDKILIELLIYRIEYKKVLSISVKMYTHKISILYISYSNHLMEYPFNGIPVPYNYRPTYSSLDLH